MGSTGINFKYFNMRYLVQLLILILLMILNGCSNNYLYNCVYQSIRSFEDEFYSNKYNNLIVERDQHYMDEVKDSYKRILKKISNKRSKYYLDTSKGFKIIMNNGGPDPCIYGLIWNEERIIRYDKCIYGHNKKLSIQSILPEEIKANTYMYVAFDLVKRWDIESIEKLNWKSITEVYSDKALMNFIDSLNKARNYNLPIGTTDPPAYTAAKNDLTKSEIETIIFQLP